MELKFPKQKKLFFKILLAAILFVFLIAKNNIANAVGSALIFTSPSQGSFNVGQTFTTDIIVDGQGTAFNAAKADISISKNLIVEDLTLGDCDFAFVKTPTTQNPSFTGVILGSSSEKCTVYKLTLKPTDSGSVYIILTNGSVKSSAKSQEILSILRNSTYTINPGSKTQQPYRKVENQQPEEVKNDSPFYKVVLGIKDDAGTPLKGAVVTLSQAGVITPGISQTYTEVSDYQGVAEFSNVPRGIYEVQTLYKNKKLAKKILNVDGENKVIVLGIGAVKKSFDQRLLLLGLIPLILVVILIFIYKRNKPA